MLFQFDSPEMMVVRSQGAHDFISEQGNAMFIYCEMAYSLPHKAARVHVSSKRIGVVGKRLKSEAIKISHLTQKGMLLCKLDNLRLTHSLASVDLKILKDCLTAD